MQTIINDIEAEFKGATKTTLLDSKHEGIKNEIKDTNQKLLEGIDSYHFQMLNAATADQFATVPNIQDWMGTQKTIEEMEYANFLSPDSLGTLRNSGDVR